jgi:hypothetical protein
VKIYDPKNHKSKHFEFKYNGNNFVLGSFNYLVIDLYKIFCVLLSRDDVINTIFFYILIVRNILKTTANN